MIRYLGIFFLFSSPFLNAQIGIGSITGARGSGMGEATVAMEGTDAIFNNPAGLIGVEKKAVILASEWRFGVKDLRPIALAFVVPSASGVLGFSINHFSLETYREDRLSVSFAKKFTAQLNVGVRLNYTRLIVSEFGAANVLGFDIGLNYLIIKDLRIAFHLHNPVSTKITEFESTPSVFSLGMTHWVNKAVLTSLEITKNIAFPASIKFGLEYHPTEVLYLRCGFATAPSKYSLGFGYALTSQFKMDMALSNHSLLGLTPALNMSYEF